MSSLVVTVLLLAVVAAVVIAYGLTWVVNSTARLENHLEKENP